MTPPKELSRRAAALQWKRKIKAWREGRPPHRNGRPPIPADERAKVIRKGLGRERREYLRAMMGWNGGEVRRV